MVYLLFVKFYIILYINLYLYKCILNLWNFEDVIFDFFIKILVLRKFFLRIFRFLICKKYLFIFEIILFILMIVKLVLCIILI